MRARQLLLVLVGSGLATFGTGCMAESSCAKAMQQVEAAQRSAAERDAQYRALEVRQAALLYQLRIHDLELEQQRTASLLASKVQELVVANQVLSRDLANAQARLRDVEDRRAQDVDATPQTEEPRKTFEAREREYGHIAQRVQALVDAGTLKAVLRDGHVRFELPRPIDEQNPW